VLDASALLAWLHEEPGGEKVEPLLGRSVVSAVNLSETLQKGLSRGVDAVGLREDLEALGLEVVSFTAEDAELAAELWAATRHLGLSLGDRACLATAKRLEVTAVTADRDWAKVEDEELRVECVR
jgi:PIN domain nuclease of toxin-antitoxin system